MITVSKIFKCDSIGYAVYGKRERDGLATDGSVTLFWDSEKQEFSINRDWWQTQEDENPGNGWKEVSRYSQTFALVMQMLANLAWDDVTTVEPLVFIHQS